mmetsp:Transcript_26190/g.53347  ORF Transcript_26190/g.53347 Transcript_26190/m.53347 type:complete len:548 (-) Transcript_26190:377-2020(-)
MEAPLIQITPKRFEAMDRRYEPHDYRDPTSQDEDKRRPSRRHDSAGFEYNHEENYLAEASRDPQSAPAARVTSSHHHIAESHFSSSSFDYRDDRSAFTTYSDYQPSKRRRTPPPHKMSYPNESRDRSHEFEAPSRRRQTIAAPEHPEAASSHSYPEYPAHRTYEQQRYYESPRPPQHPGSYVHHFGSPYQPCQSSQRRTFRDYSHSYHSTHHYHNYYPDYHYSCNSSFEHPSYRQPYNYSYPGSPPYSHSQYYDSKETPSAVTEGTTPPTEARHSGGLNLTSQYTPPAQSNPTDPNMEPMEDDRKPAAKRSHDDDEHSDQELSSNQGNLIKPSPPLPDFEPIPLEQFATFPSSPLVDSPPLSQPIDPPQVVSTSKKTRSSPQYRYASATSSGSTTSDGSSWNRRYEELKAFKERFGHCNVPQNYAENTSLGIWVNKQRMEHKNREEGKQSSLNDDRLYRLQEIGFQWAKRKGQASWDEKFNELVAYKEKHGNCHCPTKYKENTALGRWVSSQRAEYKKFCEGDLKTSMNRDKIRRLESIGFAWYMAP